jgi:hypothetical protein
MSFPDLSNALCKEVGTEFFYPSEDNERDTSVYVLGKMICSGCRVRRECLDWGVRHESHGLWGGKTPRERLKIRNQMNITLESIIPGDYS